MEQIFEEQLFLQNTFYWMLLTFGCFFHIGKEECLKKRTFIVDQKDIYRGTLKKRICQKDDLINNFCNIFGFLLFQFVEVLVFIFDFDRRFS